jgi:hypothetical protein
MHVYTKQECDVIEKNYISEVTNCVWRRLMYVVALS